MQPSSSRIEIGGVFPNLAVKAGRLPARTETGIGALRPWAGRLWFGAYAAHKASSGSGTGLFGVDDSMTLTKHQASRVGAYANRIVHTESNQPIIGPHAIGVDGGVRTFEDLADVRPMAIARHLDDPANKAHFPGVEGEFHEADVHTLDVSPLFDLTKKPDVPARACRATARFFYG